MMNWFEWNENVRHDYVLWQIHHPFEALMWFGVIVVLAIILALVLDWTIS